MKIVSDTSVIIAVIINEPLKENIRKSTMGSELIAPESVGWEIGNSFSAMLKRKRINLKLIRKALDNFNKIPINLMNINLYESLKLCKEFNIYAYDAYILECAIENDCAIITLDKNLIRIAKKLNINVIEV